MITRGVHLLCELSGCSCETLSNPVLIRSAMERAAAAANATVLNGYFHKFTPNGVSGVLCLAESHISVHTWPEAGYAAVDIFTCGESTVPHNAIPILTEALEAQDTQVREITRGLESGKGYYVSKDTSQASPKSGLFTASKMLENAR